MIIRELLLTDGPQHNGEEYIRSAALQINYFTKQECGIPQIIDVFREHGRHFIVLEHTEGNNGSISPSTIIVSPDGTYVSLIHFPILPAMALSLKASNASSPDYLAPEQARGTVGPSSDLYSLAATLHYAVTGYDPGEHMSFFYPPTRRLNPAVTAYMEAILAKQLRLSTAQRYPDAAAMQHDLEALIANHTSEDEYADIFQGTADPQQLGPLKMPESSNHLLDMGIFAAITVLMLIGLLFFLLR